MSDTPVAHYRRIWFSYNLTNDDVLECMDRFQRKFPEAIFFDTGAMRGYFDIWKDGHYTMTLADMTAGHDAPPIYRSFNECAANVFFWPPRERKTEGSSKDISARVPWPEELVGGSTGALTGSRAVPFDLGLEKDPAAWRAFGRYVGIHWNLRYPNFLPAAKNDHGRTLLDHEFPSDVKDCWTVDGISSHFRIYYCVEDPEMRPFISAVRKLADGLLTKKDLGFYECCTGRYVCPFPNDRRWEYSKRFLKILALKPNAYHTYWPASYALTTWYHPALERFRTDPNHYLGIGPSPRMKAEAFLEAGRSIDDIDGLDQATRDAEMRRYEKRIKLENKTSSGAAKGH